MYTEVLNNVLFQVGVFIVFIYVLGFVISLINKAFYRLTGSGRAVCLATGLIGTPIHELSHAVTCLLFFHKIEDIKLYQIDDSNGVLGYVSHSYNRKNLYQVLGNYFIGVAPIMVGGVVLYFMIKLLIPGAFEDINNEVGKLVALHKDGIDSSIISHLFSVCLLAIKSIFTVDFGFKTVIFLIICLCIALHMNLSGADLKGSYGSIPLFVILLFIINSVIWGISLLLKSKIYTVFLSYVSTISAYLITILTLSLIFSVILLVIGIIIKIIKR